MDYWLLNIKPQKYIFNHTQIIKKWSLHVFTTTCQNKINCDRNIWLLYSRMYIHSDNNNNNTIITTLFFIFLNLLNQTVNC